MEKWLKRFFVISLLIFLIIGFIYYFIPTDLNIAHSDKTIITIQSGTNGIVITDAQKQELIRTLQKVKFYRSTSFRRFQSGLYGNTEIALTGNYLSLIHISEPTRRTPIS